MNDEIILKVENAETLRGVKATAGRPFPTPKGEFIGIIVPGIGKRRTQSTSLRLRESPMQAGPFKGKPITARCPIRLPDSAVATDIFRWCTCFTTPALEHYHPPLFIPESRPERRKVRGAGRTCHRNPRRIWVSNGILHPLQNGRQSSQGYLKRLDLAVRWHWRPGSSC